MTLRGGNMEVETEFYWDEEIPAEHDERISKLEAEIAESKAKLAYLSRLSNQEDIY